jgi:hypothetical protein
MKRKPSGSVRKGFHQKPKGFDQKRDVRAIARERVGPVKPSRTILPPTLRKKPKHKRPPSQVEE